MCREELGPPVFHRGQGNFLGIVRFYNGAVESVRDGDRVR